MSHKEPTDQDIGGTETDNTSKEMFNSPERAQAIDEALGKMIKAAEENGALGPNMRIFERAEDEFDPNGKDLYSGQRTGKWIQKGVPINPTEGVRTSEWRTPVEGDEKSSYHWSVSINEEGEKMVTLESGVGINDASGTVVINAMSAGIKLQGRRIQDFIVDSDGTVNVRSADFSRGLGVYRTNGNETVRKATNEEIDFLQTNLPQAELVTGGNSYPMGKTPQTNTGIIAGDVAPNLVLAN